jgi:DNA primase
MLDQSNIQQLNIEDILNDYGLKYRVTSAHNANFCCPFHSDKNPSCGMHVKTGLWKCFGCGATGNIVSFVAEMDNITLPQAEEKIKKKYVQKIPDIGSLVTMVTNIMSAPHNDTGGQPTFPNWLLSKYPRDWTYMRARGIHDETSKFFDVVYDPSLGFVGFPCHDNEGKLVGITGRNTQNTDPRYSPLLRFKKSEFLFNFHRLDQTKPVICVEGEINCIAMHQHGYPNTIAFFSANVSQKQINILKNSGIKELILFFDSDEPGDRGQKYIFKNMWPYMKISVVKEHDSDPAEMTTDQVKYLVENREKYEVKLDAF